MRKFLARFIALLVVLSLTWVVGGRMLAQRWRQEADRAWAALGTPMPAFPGRFPRHGQNEPARKLDVAGARLGIAMAPAGAAGRLQPTPDDAKAFEAVQPDLVTWLDAQLGDPGDRIQAPPEKVAAFLSGRASGIADLVALLRAGEPPAWEQDLDRLMAAPIPYVKGHILLDRLLCASALEAQRQGRGVFALEAMEAAARATLSLRDRPEMISRVVELNLLVAQAGALRKLEGIPPRWYSRSAEHDARKSMLVSLQTEAWVLSTLLGRAEAPSTVTHVDGASKPEPPTILARVAAVYEKPYALMAGADYSRALARTAAALQEQKACVFEPDAMKAADEKAKNEVSVWNVSRLALPSVAAFWTVADRARFHVELSTKVLELKALRAASPDGGWPKQVPGIEASTCPGNRWTYVVSGDGRAVLSASQSPSKTVPAVRFEGPPS